MKWDFWKYFDGFCLRWEGKSVSLSGGLICLGGGWTLIQGFWIGSKFNGASGEGLNLKDWDRVGCVELMSGEICGIIFNKIFKLSIKYIIIHSHYILMYNYYSL